MTVTMKPQQLVGAERDEVCELVSRLQAAGRRTVSSAAPVPSENDLAWAEDMQLPREFFDYFVLDRAA